MVLSFLFLVWIGSAEQTVALRSGLREPGWFKVSGGNVIEFNRTQHAPGVDSVEVFDREGRRVLGLDVLKLLPGTSEVVDLDDVSSRPGGGVVVGATVRKSDGSFRICCFTSHGTAC